MSLQITEENLHVYFFVLVFLWAKKSSPPPYAVTPSMMYKRCDAFCMSTSADEDVVSSSMDCDTLKLRHFPHDSARRDTFSFSLVTRHTST